MPTAVSQYFPKNHIYFKEEINACIAMFSEMLLNEVKCRIATFSEKLHMFYSCKMLYCNVSHICFIET